MVPSQAELARLLSEDGLQVTQATLSRDLIELRAEKVRTDSGALVYAVPGLGGDRSVKTGQSSGYMAARLARLCVDLLVSAEASGNMVVLRTPAAAAGLLASAIDHSSVPAILGCVAGDDTIMIVTRDAGGGAEVARMFLELAAGV